MKIVILGAAGFIGTNLTIELAKNENNLIFALDEKDEYLDNIKKMNNKNVLTFSVDYKNSLNMGKYLVNADFVFYLLSNTIPATSNIDIANEITSNTSIATKIFDICVKEKIGKLIYFSSGGAIYGKDAICPIGEKSEENPITSYGIQKLTIEKILYLYNYCYSLNYLVVRMANPYGPFQRPNGKLGLVTNLIYKILNDEKIVIYGDGSATRDYIYIDDAIKGIVNLSYGNNKYRVYNIGTGVGKTINEVISIVEKKLSKKAIVVYSEKRRTDVQCNYLNISRYESEYGKLFETSFEEGIEKTIDYLKKYNVKHKGEKND